MEKTIDRVESKLDKITENITKIRISVARTEEHLETINGTVADHKKRIGSVEQKVWLAMGATGLFAILGYTKTIGLW